MAEEKDTICFSEHYARLRGNLSMLSEDAPGAPVQPSPVSEHVVQCIWYDQIFSEDNLTTLDGHGLRVLSPGWWNHQEGPDFKNAQIEFNGVLENGDVEIHLSASGWKQHHHHLDARYNDVILHVVLSGGDDERRACTEEGRRIPTLSLAPYLSGDPADLASVMLADEYPYRVAHSHGKCAEVVQRQGVAPLGAVLSLAGEWRMLNKARAMRERMDIAGREQGVYEAFLYACGFSHFKHHFRTIARHLPYERARQLALRDAHLLEAAFLQIAGLLPNELPEGTTAVPHFARLRALRRESLSGMRSLPLSWRRVGVRPNNNPERRLAGAARVFTRTAQRGFLESIDLLWRTEQSPLQRRRAFEALFPSASGFWATHCTWSGKKMTRPSAPLGGGRIRSIIGNVFVPASLALARQGRDRRREEAVYALFLALPKEPDNQIIKKMLPRVVGIGAKISINFQRQQGVLQLYQDWCEANPSCQNCSMLRHLAAAATE
jgi:hypothetical protein